MKRTVPYLFLLIVLALSLPAFGQGISTSTLSGTVKDKTGAVIPGAEVAVVNVDRGTTYQVLSNDSGYYTVASVPSGMYRVTVTVPGFKQTVVENVKVDVGVPATVNAILEIGEISDQVIVTGGAEIVSVSSASIGTTVDKRRMVELPLASRDALDLTMLQAGVATTGNPRSSVVNGLRKAAINITTDGLNVQDNNLRSSDGYFTYIRPRIDAIEEFTITTSTAGSDSSGGGAVNIKFVTRAGTNEQHGSAYWYHRNPWLNANYYFNNNSGLNRTRVLLNQIGVRQGGPILKEKLFYFGNFEIFRIPDAQARTRTILNADALNGRFVYTGTDGTKRTVNVLTLGQSLGFPGTVDPFIDKYIKTIQSNATSGIISNDLRTDRWSFNNTGMGKRWFLTTRLDYKITPKLAYEVIGNHNFFNSEPDFLNSMDRFGPGFDIQGSQKSNRWSASTALRWSVNPQITNEARFGMVGGTVQFFRDVPIPAFRVAPPIISSPFGYQPSSSRNGPAWHIIDNVSWAKGKHFISFGTEVSLYRRWQETVSATSPNISLGISTNDPVNTSMFSSANFPLISSTDLGTARSLYALLVGRVSGVSATVRADEKTLKYVPGAPGIDRYKQNEIGFFVQDAWRVTPALTVNLGLRYEFIGVPDPLNKLPVLPVGGLEGIYGISGVGNLFQPGLRTGSEVMLDSAGTLNGRPFYKNDWNNFAPSVGFAWQPEFESGPLRVIFGERGRSVLRGGYSISYIRDGFFNATGVVDTNAGQTASGNLTADVHYTAGSLMLRNPLPALVVNPSEFKFPTPQSPLRFSNSIAGFDPDMRIPYTQSWSFGFEREILRDTVLEFRYVANRGVKLWRRININEINIFENGFLNEFRLAQNNLAISRANGRGENFRNQGLAGQVDLPITAAMFGSATSSNFGSATYTNHLDNGTAGGMANTLAGSATFYTNMINSGRPANFWKVNPDAVSALVATNAADSNYHSLQIEMRRRMTRGIFTQVNYTFSKALNNDDGNSTGSNSFYTLRDLKRSYVRAGYDVTQRVNVNFIYEPPIGRGRSFLSSGLAGKLLEGWQFGGIGRMQSGNPFELSSGRATFNQYDAGVVLKGITRKELQEQVQVRYNQAARKVYYFPENLIGSDGRANPSFIDVPKTPGVWGDRIILDGPGFVRFDLSAVKKTYISETLNVEFRAEFMNAFNNINFLTPASGTLGTTFGEVTSAYRDVSTTNDPGGRWIQFVLRINW